MKTSIQLNDIQTEAVDNDIVMFEEPLYIVGTRERQWNGTIYDLKTTDISQWDGTITADHSDRLQDVIGKAIGLKKRIDGITISGIKYAIKENPLAVLAKNLLLGGFATGFSCETIGPDPDDEGVWHNHSLCGLSQVSHPNDKLAYAVVSNSMEEARILGYNKKEVNSIKENMNKIINNIDAENSWDFEKNFVDILLYGRVNLVGGARVWSPLTVSGQALREAVFAEGNKIKSSGELGIETSITLNNMILLNKYYYDMFLERNSEEGPGVQDELENQAWTISNYLGAVEQQLYEPYDEEDAKYMANRFEKLHTVIPKILEAQIGYLKNIESEEKIDAHVAEFENVLNEIIQLLPEKIKADSAETKEKGKYAIIKKVNKNSKDVIVNVEFEIATE